MARKVAQEPYSYKEPLHQRPIFNYAVALLSITAIALSIFALLGNPSVSGAAVSNSITVDDFLQKLISHPEASAYAGVAPLNIIQVNNNNLANLQSQISGLDVSYVGSFLVQFPDSILIYDYNQDTVVGTIPLAQQPQLPADFFIKLNAHPETQGLQNEQPVGGPFDQQTLSSLQQQFPEVYSGAKIGDYLLRYSTKLVIYDYNSDRIVNSVDLG
jgi:hypothetical protein